MPRDRPPKNWDELSELADGAGEQLVLPPREIEPDRQLEFGEEIESGEDS